MAFPDKYLTLSFANPFQKKGRWLKGNTHTHTRNSDGQWTPEEVRQEYGRHGYDFVFLADHWKRTVPAPSPKRPLLIPAEELDFVLRGNLYHAVCLGIRRQWPRRSFASLGELTRLAARHGIYLVMAHPYWSGSRSETYLSAGDFPAVEVYNTVCDRGIAKGYSATYWDDFLDAGRRVHGIACDDAHSSATAIGGWIMVKAAACTESAILAALRQGHFYATQGPIIQNIRITGRRIAVTSSPVSRINFISNRASGRTVRSQDQNLTQAEWEIPMGATYVRIECVDGSGKTAWSNPIWQSVHPRLEAVKRRTLQQATAPRLSGKRAHGDPSRVDWSAARPLRKWTSLMGESSRRKVEGRLVHDGQYLYVQLEERLDPRRLVVKDDKVWNEDEWELFFARQRGRACRQLGVNARGVHQALAHGESTATWDSGAVVVSNTRLPDRWQVRIALPLARLARGGVRPGDTIYLNIIRSTETSKALCWIPTFRMGYLEPNRLGAVLLARR